MDDYHAYQVGNGATEDYDQLDIPLGFRRAGARYQTGAGVGSYLKGLYRDAIPKLKRGAKEVGKEALLAGARIINDVVADDKPITESVRNRLIESGGNLKRKAAHALGDVVGGILKKEKRTPKNAHSVSANGSVKTVALKKKYSTKKVPRSARDIFEK